jgi:hypothetical protein
MTKHESGNLGRPFVLRHCWKILEYTKKWKTRGDDTFSIKKSKSSNSSSPMVDNMPLDSDDTYDDDNDKWSATPTTEKRPPGRKADKE